MHDDDRNMLPEFQINPIDCLVEMAKRSSGFVTMQQQQLERAELNVEMIACTQIRPEDTCTWKNNQILAAKPHASRNPSMQQQKASQQPVDLQVRD